MQKVKHFAKVLITGLCFVVFGLICTTGNLLFLPVVILGLNKIKFVERFCRWLVRHSWAFFIFFTEIVGYLRVDYKGLSKIPNEGAIIVANHPSLLDVVLIISRVPNINCIVKASLHQNIFLGFAIKACNYIPNSENEVLLNRSIESLKKGENILVFPEGTRTKEEIIFHKAASHIAIKGAKILVPIFIKMTPRSLKKGQSWYKTPNQTISYEISVKEPLLLDDFRANHSSPIAVRNLHSTLTKLYKELA